MKDADIVELYWRRSEEAITETERSYGGYCRRIALNICGSREDSEECVNDTWLAAWNQMPDKRPVYLSPFLGAICRNLAINLMQKSRAAKRGGGQAELALSELEECIPSDSGVEMEIELRELRSGIRAFIKTLKDSDREIFIARYWHMAPIAEIARRTRRSEGNIRVILHRTRQKLRSCLEEEGLC